MWLSFSCISWLWSTCRWVERRHWMLIFHSSSFPSLPPKILNGRKNIQVGKWYLNDSFSVHYSVKLPYKITIKNYYFKAREKDFSIHEQSVQTLNYVSIWNSVCQLVKLHIYHQERRPWLLWLWCPMSGLLSGTTIVSRTGGMSMSQSRRRLATKL